MRRHAVASSLVLALAAAGGHAQPNTFRLRGVALSERGEPVPEASIRLAAFAGLRGAQFVGQREWDTRSDARGRWMVLGVVRGAWLLQANAPGFFPHAMAVPIEMMESSGQPTLRWEPPLVLQPAAAVVPEDASGESWARLLSEAATRAGDRPEQTAGRLSEIATHDIEAGPLCAAGDLALIIWSPSVAEELFRRALQKAPDSFRPYLGLASAALMQGDIDLAAKSYAAARDRTRVTALKQTLSAALADLNKVSGPR
jgi:hypothetical protein